MTKTSIILGLGFGDEGKGLVTDYLSLQNPNSIVVRFSGGQNATHTVVHENGTRHAFSSFGSGTLRNIPSYTSKYCTMNPITLMNEYRALKEKGIEPKLYMDNLAMVTTPYDIFANRAAESFNRGNGSCGVGIGTTMRRNESPYKLYAQDLLVPFIWKNKLAQIKNYYENQPSYTIYSFSHDIEKTLKDFEDAIEDMVLLAKTNILWTSEKDLFSHVIFSNMHVIFEGSQGVLLDKDFGFFPNVTYANTTSKNAIEIIENNHLDYPNIYYVTRAYQTRHGKGIMTNEDLALNIRENPLENNVTNTWQGEFRKTLLDMDLLNYALTCDSNFNSNHESLNLVMTCCDQVDGLKATENGMLAEYDNINALVSSLVIKPEKILQSYSDCAYYLLNPQPKEVDITS